LFQIRRKSFCHYYGGGGGGGGGRNYSNLSVEEIKALKDLKNYRDIIIKEADKGSAVLVWDRKDYCSEAYRHVNDMVVYEKLQKNPLNYISDRV
jgi:glutamine amidotransferase-like uncharacterized protein